MFGNTVIQFATVEEALKLNRYNRFEVYLNDILDETSVYIRKKCKEESKRWNSVVGYIREYIKNESIYINEYMKRKGFEGNKGIRNTINSILLMYAKLKYFGLNEISDTPTMLTCLYKCLKFGYIPCGWAGKIHVGGSLYVY